MLDVVDVVVVEEDVLLDVDDVSLIIWVVVLTVPDDDPRLSA